MKVTRSKQLVTGLLAGVGLLTLSLQAQAADYCTDAPVNGANYKLINVGADLLLGAQSDAKKAYTVLQSNNGKASQRFTLNYQSSSHYWAIQASNTAYAATVEGGSRSNGALIQQKPFANRASQEWELKQVTSGSYKGAYKIVNRNSSLSLAANGSSSGAAVVQSTENSSSAQRWWLEPVSVSCSSSDASDNVDVTLNGSVGDGEVTLTWSDPGNGTNFQVYQDTDSNPSGRVRIAKLGPTTLSYKVTGLKNGTTYYFWIKYTNNDGKNGNSSLFSGKPQKDDSDDNSGSSSDVDSSSSAAEPTAAAAKKAGANDEPQTNGYPSFIESTFSGATVVSNLSDFLDAIKYASAGDVIYIREGTYKPSSPIKIENNGSSSDAIILSAYPGDDRPVFDFSSMSEKSSNRGFEMNADYWHIYGFDIKKAGDNGMHVTGSHNTIEFMAFYENHDTGLQIDSGGAYNFVKNSDSYYNADSSLENADGFAAKLGVGTGNYFYGCRAWQNLDDGFDGYLRDNGSTITTTHEYSWMIRNGYKKDGSEGAGDGNGFKTGGSDDKDLAHNGLYINTISADNTQDGYDQNSNRGEVTIYNAIAYKNNRNYGLSDGESRILKKLTVKNSISLESNSSDKFGASSTSISNNSWQEGGASSSDFEGLNISDLLRDRQADGSLPIVKFGHLKSSSELIDAGTDVGLDYKGSAPDLGSFETK